MGELRGFMEHPRLAPTKEKPEQRTAHFCEFLHVLEPAELGRQGARCMDCGVPFCHTGCPLGNLIPDWNDLVYRQQWERALERLHATNNFPEFTGRICPAPCEAACVLGINEDPVAIKQIEVAIADRAIDEGWIVPRAAAQRTGRRVAIVGSGPAGLAAAQQLARAGHQVTLFERADRPGGLLMYGIPDFKLEKQHVWRRIQQLEAEGVEFRCGVNVGVDVSANDLKRDHDALLLTGGATQARDLPIPGRELRGIHPAMEFLPQQNRRNQGDIIPDAESILATGRDVIIIGGGDTGSDCTGTSNRQRAASVTQFELLPMPPDLGSFPRRDQRPAQTPWPQWPIILRTSTSHEEGCARQWSVLTKEFRSDDSGRVRSLTTVDLEWYTDPQGRQTFREVEGTQREWPTQLVLLAMGFTGPERCGPIEQLGLTLDARGNVQCDERYQTCALGVFAAGDMRRGQSLVVWAIHEGREAARAIDLFLMGTTSLPTALSTHVARR